MYSNYCGKLDYEFCIVGNFRTSLAKVERLCKRFRDWIDHITVLKRGIIPLKYHLLTSFHFMRKFTQWKSNDLYEKIYLIRQIKTQKNVKWSKIWFKRSESKKGPEAQPTNGRAESPPVTTTWAQVELLQSKIITKFMLLFIYIFRFWFIVCKYFFKYLKIFTGCYYKAIKLYT